MSEPLTPPQCDLQDFPFMPLHVARLRDSDLAARAHPEALWYAVMLWSASWHQLPAASLPDDEVVLARLCGLGRDLRTFRKHRDDAMHGFVLCSDGRLYHPVVAEQARTAWESKLQQRWRSECARVKKFNQRNGLNKRAPTYEEFLSGASPENDDPSPQLVPGDTAECPPGHALQETGTGTGTGILKEEANASIVAEATQQLESLFGDEPPARPKPAKPARVYPADFEAAWAAYPHHKGRSSKPNSLTRWKALPPDERAGLVAAIAAFRPNVGEVCGGKGAPDMAAWLNAGKHLNWIGDAQADQVTATPAFSGPTLLRAALVSATDEKFARGYLDPCGWQEVPFRAVIAVNAYVAGEIVKAIGPQLERSSVRVIVNEQKVG